MVSKYCNCNFIWERVDRRTLSNPRAFFFALTIYVDRLRLRRSLRQHFFSFFVVVRKYDKKYIQKTYW